MHLSNPYFGMESKLIFSVGNPTEPFLIDGVSRSPRDHCDLKDTQQESLTSRRDEHLTHKARRYDVGQA